jgi:hypothetical protein
MTDPNLRFKPHRLEQLPPQTWFGSEMLSLKRLQQQGLPLAPISIIPAAIEEHFYRLNNLPRQLAELFAALDPGNPDEDDIEDLAPAAAKLLKMHYLLDEVIDIFYEAIHDLGASLSVRRSGEAGYECSQGRPALMALRNLWLDDWSYEAIMKRLEQTQSIGPQPRPVLVHAADEPAPPTLNTQASRILEKPIALWQNQAGITRVRALELL